jgi:hypothetical protein
MQNIDKDNNVLSDAEVDSIMQLLEASFANTGDRRIFEIIDILMHDTRSEIINNTQQNATNTCCTCQL